MWGILNRERIDAALRGVAKRSKAARVRDDARLSSDGEFVERQAGAIFFRYEGWRYHVYDVELVGNRIRKLPYESPRLTHRVFVSADGTRKTYTRARGEVGAITGSALERQFQAAKYLQEGPLVMRRDWLDPR